MSNKEIKKLINNARHKDSDAFAELIKFHTADMYRVAVAILKNDEDAADAIQDTILACWEKMDTLKETKYFKTWLIRILINKCYDIQKKYIKETAYDEVQETPIYDEYNVELKEALNSLSEKYRIPIMMYYGEGYRIKEISQMINIPVSTIQTRLARGREQLARYFGKGREKTS